MDLRVTYLGSYTPSAQLAPGILENRMGIVSSLVGVIMATALAWEGLAPQPRAPAE